MQSRITCRSAWHLCRVLGSRGQDLAALADNCPPAMVAASQVGTLSPRASHTASLVALTATSPLSRSSTPHEQQQQAQQNGSPVRHLRSQQNEEDAEPGASAPANGHMPGRQGDGGVRINIPGVNGENAELRDGNVRHQDKKRAWGPEWGDGLDHEAGVSDRRPMMSPFETEHAQSGALSGSGPGATELTSVTSLEGQLPRWWARFDARVMQPLFGGPPEPSIHTQAAPAVPVLVTSALQHSHARQVQIPVVQTLHGVDRAQRQGGAI